MSKRTGHGVVILLLVSNLITGLYAFKNNPNTPHLTQVQAEMPEPDVDTTNTWTIESPRTSTEQPSIKWAKDMQTAQAVYNQLQELDIQHPDIVLCQVILETGHFSSHAYHHRNNLLGLGGDHHRNMRFNDKTESLKYYKKWQDKLYTPTRKGDYFDFLNRLTRDNRGRWLRYATDPLYTTKLKQIYHKMFGANALAELNI